VLRLDGVEAGYGDVVAVRSVSLEVRAGEIVALIGSNGAGKTTTLRAISGLLPLRQGRVELDGRPISGLGSPAIVAAGIAHVPEGRQLFPTMTVQENLELGARTAESRARRAETLGRVIELFPRLGERRRQLTGTLSGGEQQMVAIGRALMSAPKMLLLDEPSLGLSPLLSGELFRALGRIRGDGIGVLLVEQNARKSLAIADRGYLIENGRIVGAGRAAELASDPAVQRAYLGGAR
jgi:ABC-type branched-subunit amino acid transport system ATPase component